MNLLKYIKDILDPTPRCWNCGSDWIEEEERDHHMRCQLCGADQEKKPNPEGDKFRQEAIAGMSRKVIKKYDKTLQKLARE